MARRRTQEKAEKAENAEKTEKTEKKPAAQRTAVKPSEASAMISASKLKSLLSEGRKMAEKTSEAAGEFGSMLKAAVEKNGLNKTAFGWIRRLDKMEPEKLANVLDHFDYYLDISGIEKRADQVQRLPNIDQPAEVEDESASKTNVRPFPAPSAVADA